MYTSSGLRYLPLPLYSAYNTFFSAGVILLILFLSFATCSGVRSDISSPLFRGESVLDPLLGAGEALSLLDLSPRSVVDMCRAKIVRRNDEEGASPLSLTRGVLTPGPRVVDASTPFIGDISASSLNGSKSLSAIVGLLDVLARGLVLDPPSQGVTLTPLLAVELT